jgi:hypothetical protein
MSGTLSIAQLIALLKELGKLKTKADRRKG